MRPDVCPTCGQPRLTQTPLLPPIKQRIFDLVRRFPGVDAETLRSRVWESDPNGGPENLKCVHVHIHQLNRLIHPLGIRVRGSRTGGYRLLSIEGDNA